MVSTNEFGAVFGVIKENAEDFLKNAGSVRTHNREAER
jgi:hypothetical protein